jgi:hypothetical protein
VVLSGPFARLERGGAAVAAEVSRLQSNVAPDAEAAHCQAESIRALNPVLRGWAAHFKLAETKRALKDCDGWIRHKLRCVLWRQWKRSYVRARNLMHRGLTEERAWRSATTTGTARGGTLARVTCTRCSRSLGSTAWG